jgi:hypothetical protein
MGIQNSTNTGFTIYNSGSTVTRGGFTDGLLPVPMMAAIQTDYSLFLGTTPQAAFPITNDTWTIEPNTTYLVKGQYLLTTGTTTHTTAMGFSGSNATVVSSMEYFTTLYSAGFNTVTTVQSTTHVSGIGSKVINATSVQPETTIQFKGILRTNNSGTLVPQIAFSAIPNGACIMKVGSYIQFIPLGTATFEKIGSVA